MNIRTLFLTIICCMSSVLNAATLIFDMDGVLVRRSMRRIIWQVGPLNFLGLFNHLRLDDLLYDFLEQIVPRDASTPEIIHNGRRMSAFMILWLQGKITHEEAIRLIEETYKRVARAVDSKRKIALIKEIACAIVTPARFASMMQPVEKGVKLLKKCYRAKDAHGGRKNKIYILTNWDAASFDLLVAESDFADFLDMCDGFIVSGSKGYIKPQREIFEICFEDCNIDPDNELTIYIDDDPQNISSAYSLNRRMLRPILCKNFNFKSIKKKLKELEVL